MGPCRRPKKLIFDCRLTYSVDAAVAVNDDTDHGVFFRERFEHYMTVSQTTIVDNSDPS